MFTKSRRAAAQRFAAFHAVSCRPNRELRSGVCEIAVAGEEDRTNEEGKIVEIRRRSRGQHRWVAAVVSMVKLPKPSRVLPPRSGIQCAAV